MLSGKELGDAIRTAMDAKGVKQGQVAEEFGIKQPSVSEWLKTGRVAKGHIAHLVRYFSDVVGPTHWGLDVATDIESERVSRAYLVASAETRRAFKALADAVLVNEDQAHEAEAGHEDGAGTDLRNAAKLTLGGVPAPSESPTRDPETQPDQSRRQKRAARKA